MKQALERKLAMERPLSRREMLVLMGAAAASVLSGSQRGQAAQSAMAMPSCVVRPLQTEGPYFVDEKLHRSDIRSEPSDGRPVQGVPLRLAFQVSRVRGWTCSPLAGALVDIWQCDAFGVYSGVLDMNGRFDTRGKKFLRGHQRTDASGIAEFLTIYPGWYQGRAVHIHFKIRAEAVSRRAYEFTSQLYFDDTITAQVHNQSPYNVNGGRRTTNDADVLFRRGGSQLMPALTRDTHGYAARFDIGLELS